MLAWLVAPSQSQHAQQEDKHVSSSNGQLRKLRFSKLSTDGLRTSPMLIDDSIANGQHVAQHDAADNADVKW